MVLLCIKEFEYEMRIWKDEMFVLSQPVGNEMQLTFDKKANAIEWISYHGGEIMGWSFRFNDDVTSSDFKTSIAVGLMETSRQAKFSDIVSKGEKEWIEEGYFEDPGNYENPEGDEGKEFDSESDYDF